jgi:hypothetical protein
MILGKYSFGIGDRFGLEGDALLSAVIQADKAGVEVTPVWNKSHREHTIIGTTPEDVREEADDAVAGMGWVGNYYVDADHINFGNVDEFIKWSDFFTLDVADYIGQQAQKDEVDRLIDGCVKYIDGLSVPGIKGSLAVGEGLVRTIADKYLSAVKQAGRIYRHIASKKGVGNFVVELSMDEAEAAQTPVELFFILAAAAQEELPAQTIAEIYGQVQQGRGLQGRC